MRMILALMLFFMPLLTAKIGPTTVLAETRKAIPQTTPGTIQPVNKPLRTRTRVPRGVTKLRFVKAVITDLRFGTKSDGRWYWTAIVRNTGTAQIKSGDLTVQATQKTNNPSAPKLAASGRAILQNIQPGQTAEVTAYWNRCKTIKELSAALYNNLTHTKIHTKVITQIPMISIANVGAKNLRWFPGQKKWNIDVRNGSIYTLKLIVQGALRKQGAWQWQPVGGQMFVVAPGATRTSMKFSAPQAANGDNIKVTVYQKTNKAYCKDDGAIGSWNMTIPNSWLNIP